MAGLVQACPGHPRLCFDSRFKTWMPATIPGSSPGTGMTSQIMTGGMASLKVDCDRCPLSEPFVADAHRLPRLRRDQRRKRADADEVPGLQPMTSLVQI